MGTRLFYVDDSGARVTGFVTYSWIDLDMTRWNECLHQLLDWRRGLWRRHGIPVEFELHATKFLNGRTEPSQEPRWRRDKKGNARAVGAEGLALCADMASAGVLRMGTAYRRVPTSSSWTTARGEVYEGALLRIDGGLAAIGDLGMVVMDGDGTDPTYRRAHRRLRLSTRAIVEDPTFQPAHESQFVQMADLVAYVAYQHLLAHPDRTWVHRWFPDHLEAGHDGRLWEILDEPAPRPDAPQAPSSDEA